MSLWKQKAKPAGGATEVPPAGAHPAVLVAMLDLGTHENEYKGKKTKQRKVYLAWELVEEKMAGSTFNHVLGKEFTLSLGEKAQLRKLVDNWRGKKLGAEEEFDVSVLLGKPCLLTVTHSDSTSGRTFAQLAGVSKLPPKLTASTPKRSPTLWTIGDGDWPGLDWLPWVYGEAVFDKVQRSPEWRTYAAGRGGGAEATGTPAGREPGEDDPGDNGENEGDIPF